jgi:hypothetical protein
MLKLILLAMLVLASSSALAKWVKVNEDDRSTTYIDTPVKHESGTKVKIWILSDKKISGYRTLQNIPFMSSKTEHEIDCVEEKSRIVFYSDYSENMGKGKNVKEGIEPNSIWSPITTDDAEKAWLKIACPGLKI